MTTGELASVPTYRDRILDLDLPGRLPLPAGTVAGQFRLMEPIGRGSFGTVYRALHPVIGKEVAIKVLDCALSEVKLPVERFIAEARAINRIRHRNVVAIFDFGELASGEKFFVMELLRGETLSRTLKRGRLPIEEAVSILEALAQALDAAHRAGVLHRDIKPSNVFLNREMDGTVTVKLLDFGVAKVLEADATVSGAALGTPAYMAPEQHGDAPLSAAADIYSLGVLAYELLTGARPFRGASVLEVIRLHLLAEPPSASSRDASLPPALDGPLAMMLRKDASERPASATDAVRALRLALEEPRSCGLDDVPTQLAPAAYPEGETRAQGPDEVTLEASSTNIPYEVVAPQSRRLASLVAGYLLATACALLLLLAWSRLGQDRSARPQGYATRASAPSSVEASPSKGADAVVAAVQPVEPPPLSRMIPAAPLARVKVAPSAPPSAAAAKPKAALVQRARAPTTAPRPSYGDLEF